jgi:hypothetical protein
MEDDLEHWQWVLDQRTADHTLELSRREDDELLKILKANIDEATSKIEELTNE